MTTDQRFDCNSKNESTYLFSPKKKGGGVFQKTKVALGIVNSKLKSNGRKGDALDMMLFESDSSFDFNPEEDLGRVRDPLQSSKLEKSERIKEDGTPGKGSTENIGEGEANVDCKISQQEEETVRLASGSRKISTPTKYARTVGRNARSTRQFASSQPPRSKSSGNIVNKSNKKPSSDSGQKPSSARLTRHLSVPVPANVPAGGPRSPGIHRKHLSTPTHGRKEPIHMDGVPQTPGLTPVTETKTVLDTPVQEATGAETSWKRVSDAFDDGHGAMGGYFAKLLEKMEGDGTPEETKGEKLDCRDEKIDEKKPGKFKTPKGIRKLFSMGKSRHDPVSDVMTEDAYEENNMVDMAVFTAFISSPNPSDSPRRSEREHIQPSSEHESDPNLDDFPEIPSEKQTRLEDIRRDVNWNRERSNSSSERPSPPTTPTSMHSRNPTTRSFAEHTAQSSPKCRRSVVRDPGSPGTFNSAHRRGGKREWFDGAQNQSEESIPRHSMSNRRNRTAKPTETRSNVDEQLPRSSHRQRRTRVISSRSSSDSTDKQDSQLGREKKHANTNGASAEENSRPCNTHPFGDSMDPQGVSGLENDKVSFKENSVQRKKRISSGRLDTRGVSSHSSSVRRTRTSGTRKPDRPISERSFKDPPPEPDISPNTAEASAQNSTNDSISDDRNSLNSQFLLSQGLGSESQSPSISRRKKPVINSRKTVLMKSSSMSNVHKGCQHPRDTRRPTSLRMKRQSSEMRLSSVSESAERHASVGTDPLREDDDKDLDSPSIDNNILVESNKRLPSLSETLERGSELNVKLFQSDDQETVVTDDGSLWLDQGSVSGLEIKSSSSVTAPQLLFDQKMTRIVEDS